MGRRKDKKEQQRQCPKRKENGGDTTAFEGYGGPAPSFVCWIIPYHVLLLCLNISKKGKQWKTWNGCIFKFYLGPPRVRIQYLHIPSDACMVVVVVVVASL